MLSTSIKLNDKNFDEISSRNKLMVILFWDPWCHHCKAFKPTWYQLADNSKYDVIFADTNCVENKAFCKKISNNGYPQVLFYDPDRKVFIVYDGVMNFESIETFIHKQINFPIIFLDSVEDLTPYRLLTDVSTLFVMKISSEKENYIQIFRDTAIQYRNSSSNFVLINSSSTELFVYKSFDRIVYYDDDWSIESINSFVKTNSLPLLAPLTDGIFENFRISKELCFNFFIDNQDQFNQSLQIITELNSSIQFFYFNHNEDDYICRFIGVKRKKLPQLYVIDIAHQLWSPLSEEFSSEGIKKWLDNFDKIKWKGPGVGVFSNVYSTFYSIWATGGLTLGVVIFGIIFIIVLIIYTIYDACTIFREDPVRLIIEKEE